MASSESAFAQIPFLQCGTPREQCAKIEIEPGHTRVMTFAQPFKDVALGDSEIADVVVKTDRVLLINAKQKVGTTNLILFDDAGAPIHSTEIVVRLDPRYFQQEIRNLQQKIRSTTGSNGIRVDISNDHIVLRGLASDSVAAERAVQVAKTMVPEGNVVNVITVAPAQQVMLRVRFLEVARTASRELGVNWNGANNAGNRGFATGLGTVSAGGRPAVVGVDASGNPSVSPGLPIFNTAATLLPALSGVAPAPFGVALASLANKGGSLDVTLSALEMKGLVRRLAEPDLVALSGDTASFLAGGEFPVPSVQPGSTGGVPVISTEYKPFGVQLTFVPTVLAGGIINLRLVPSVSELDFTQTVQISGSNVPSITKREARTTIELRDGQSFAIAGLLQARNQRDISQLPWIGSVPVIGALFRSAAYQQQETDLVVIVTPHLVAPSVPGQRLASPLDNYIPTNDVDFFLMGDMEQKKKFRDYITSGGGIQGPYGHIIRSAPALPPISAKN
jgi:pilus assembly protein CpaC